MVAPYHIAIVMDGNGRWAKKRKLPRIAGHWEGAKRVKETLQEAKKIGVKVLTIFAFSTENWDRPGTEVKFIFSYFVKFLKDHTKGLQKDDIQFRVIGRRDRIDKKVLAEIKDVESLTRGNKSFIFNVALDYGGRWDIVNAAKRIAQECLEKNVSPEDINEELFSKYLSLGGEAAPDLLIRTSGEKRMSNFLIWDLAYSEFYFTPVFWPDFDKKELHEAVKAYAQRERRFGAIHEKTISSI